MNSILIKRIKACGIDYLILCLLGLIFISFSEDIYMMMFILYPLAINKDFLNGKSIGKRLVGLQVQNLNGQKSSEWKNSLRNFLPIIPIDFLFTLISPTRRIGDRIANTKIGIESEINFKTITSELRNYRFNKGLIFGIIYGIANVYCLLWIYDLMLLTTR